MPDKFTRVFPGDVALSETQAACKTTQQNHTANLIGLKPALLKKSDGTKQPVNVADFDEDDDGSALNIFADLRLIDVSTPQGATDAAALGNTHTKRFSCKAHVAGAMKDVEVYGRKPSV